MTGMMLEPTHAGPGKPVRHYTVQGGGGVTLRAREWGNSEGPGILFIHGWSQCDLCWGRQVAGALAARFRLITFDNRGHGESDKPRDADSYREGRLWADDLAAVIEETRLEKPVVVAWSYGGLIVTDYIRFHGESNVAGIDLVGGAVLLRPPRFDHVGSRPARERAGRVRAGSCGEHRGYPPVSSCLHRAAAPRGPVVRRAVLEHGRSTRDPWRPLCAPDRRR